MLLTPTAALFATETNGQKASVTEEAEETAETITIRSLSDFLEFAENCRDDDYSLGKTVKLCTNVDLSEVEDFAGIPYFDGIFEGNGHAVSNVKIERDGSEYGLFRYVGRSGQIRDLNVSGNITMTGSQENIGGIAGVNYGIISNCTYTGSIQGTTAVGAIVGCNKASGTITGCVGKALVQATDNTGGIAGSNEGIISECKNEGSINVEDTDMTLDLDGVDLGTLNILQNVVNKNNMGGIAGISSGVISGCENTGTIGYPHTSYNVGGIVGGQNGKVIDCTNSGEVYGRKDVGGIAGQAEPYVETEYLQDRINETRDEIDQLNRTLGSISETVSQTSAQVKEYTDSLDSISDNVSSLTQTADTSDPQTKEYVDDINAALDNIQSVEVGEDGATQEQQDTIRDNLSVISDNLTNLQNRNSQTEADTSSESASTDSTAMAEQFASQISDQWNNDVKSNETVQNIVDTIDSGIQSIDKSIKSASRQINRISDEIGEDLDALSDGTDYIEDISSVATAETTDGVISGCTNSGKINGDLNVGGIAGNMNIEYDADPEVDPDFSGTSNVKIRSTVNVVILHSRNYGEITAKKSASGGVVGFQELGIIYDCEGYGSVEVESGTNLGGVVGESDATLQKCYSQCLITGSGYVGGIAGSGTVVTDSISICTIDADGERIGALIGYLKEEGDIRNNFFANDTYGGVDNINYAEAAKRTSYEEIMEMEGVPEGFNQVAVTFKLEDEVLDQKTIAYGSSVPEKSFPEIPEKEGYYVEWDHKDACENITENLIFTASYIPWTESVASDICFEEGHAAILAVGEFFEDTVMQVTECDGPDLADGEGELLYAYNWELVNEEDQDFAETQLHLYAGEDRIDNAVLMAQVNGTWEKMDAAVDGSYLVADVPFGAAVAVIMEPESRLLYYVAGAAAVVVLALLIRSIRSARRKQRRKSLTEEQG
jgi:phage shock protein A